MSGFDETGPEFAALMTYLGEKHGGGNLPAGLIGSLAEWFSHVSLGVTVDEIKQWGPDMLSTMLDLMADWRSQSLLAAWRPAAQLW